MRSLHPAVLLMTLLVGAPPAPPQSISGSISGRVTDSSGGVLSKARITVRSLDTGLVRETETDDAGYYEFPSLNAGRYTVEFVAEGFDKLVRGPLSVEVAVERTVDAELRPGGPHEVIAVRADAPLIEIRQAQLSKGVDAVRIMELPGLHALDGLALLQPGAAANNNGRPGSGFTVNGGRTRSNNFTIDGANNNDQSLAAPRQSLPPEHIAQFRIITNTFSAGYGRNSGSYVNQITKSGGNEFHGAARWSWLGNGLNALSTGQERTYDAARRAGFPDRQALRRARQVEVRNQALASAGGPIRRDHSFFYAGYDRDWRRATAMPVTIAISPEGMRSLEANGSLFAPGALEFLKKTFPVANDPTQRGQINVTTPGGGSIAVPLQQFNRGLNGPLPYARSFSRAMIKTDVHVTAGDQVSFRYLLDETVDPGAPSAIAGNEVGFANRNQSATVSNIHVLSSTTVNESRATYARRGAHYPENLPPYFNISGFNSVGDFNYPQSRVDNLYEFTDNLSLIRGRHSVRAGADVLRYQLNSIFAPNLNGFTQYPSLGDFLFDRNATYQRYAGETYLPARTTEFGIFFRDDLRVSSALTLNLGARYEYAGAPFGYFSNARPDLNNVGQRVGFAWSPRSSQGFPGKIAGGKFVLRGGWSLAYDQVFQNILLNVSRNYPRGVNIALSQVSGQRLFDPAARPEAPRPEEFKGDPGLLPYRYFAKDKRVKLPYSQQFSLGIERQFFADYALKIFYVGTRGVGLPREVEANIGFNKAAIDANPAVYRDILPSLQPVRDSQGVVTAYRRDPSRASVLVGDALAQSSYHSLQVTAEKRFSRSFSFEVNYTWSCFVNDSDDIVGGQINNTLPAVPFNFRLDRGRSGFDQPHRAVTNFLWALPRLRRGLKGSLLNGWKLAGIATLASGTPYTILNADNALGILPGQIATVEFSQRASVNLSGVRPLPTSRSVANPYFVHNPSNSGMIGNAGRNTERTGKTVAFDAALVRDLHAGERHTVQIRWELFNLLNHRNFTVIPANTVTRDTDAFRFMNLGQTNVAGRSMTFHLRYLF